MIERVAYQDIIELILCAVGLVAFLILVVWITTPPPIIIPEGSYLDAAGAVVPVPEGMMLNNESILIPKPTPIPTPTPRQLPIALPTIPQITVDPYIHGERWEGQWFKWYRPDVVGLMDLHAGIIVYDHAWLDSYTWYNTPMGQYYKQEPTKGNRYFAVWINQEAFGTDAHNNTGFYPFYENAFRLQVKDRLIEVDTVHNPTCRILEFDNKDDYYNAITAPPLGYYIKRVGYTPETGGYVALRIGEIHIGKSNSESGYLLFEVPKDTQPEDVMLLGNFQRFGTAYWRFE